MKPGDIVRNWSASSSNPRRCFVVTDVGRLDVLGFDREFREVCFERKNSHLEVVGAIDLAPLDRALEEHATQECKSRSLLATSRSHGVDIDQAVELVDGEPRDRESGSL